ncbi:metallophosphoesterase family protein [Levilactobacillus acidifarinae]|uniref:metallophosphoesterase family protein n=1 Tax=Levilactobacillus acidifarinae TaxID=267364 RepID=UPI00070B2511|nr:metallophosphoesterase [Levilactobacillus acidifarinae]GEO70100.1 3',5'-cyclic-nucleotide phosphodiesterase [Levilactobacillus acidifarinae]
MNKYTVIHVSDVQLTPPLPTAGTAAVANLQLIFDDVASRATQPDLIVIGGDLIQRGSEADYRWLRTYLTQQSERLGAPIQVILGDQDNRDAFNAGYLGQAARPYYAYKQNRQNMDFYFLDSKWETRRSAGWLARDQLDWLNKSLHLAPRRRAFIFLHHPLDAPALRNMRYTLLQNNRELLAILHGHNVGGIFAGHLHFAANYLVDNALPVTVAGAASTYIDCRNPHQHAVHRAVSYNVITIERGIASVTVRPLRFDSQVQAVIPVGNTGFTKHRPRLLRPRRA